MESVTLRWNTRVKRIGKSYGEQMRVSANFGCLVE